MHTYEYNTTKEPIRLKKYGRLFQCLINQTIDIPDTEAKENACENILIPLMQRLQPTKKNKKENAATHLWDDLFVASEHRLNISLPTSLPNKTAIEKSPQPIPYKKKNNLFRCCGEHLAKVIHSVCSQLKGNPHAKEYTATLVKLVRQAHRKVNNLNGILKHIETIAQIDLPFSHEEIANWHCLKTNKVKTKMRHSKRKSKTPHQQNR